MKLAELVLMPKHDLEIAADGEYSDQWTAWEAENFDDDMNPKKEPVPPAPKWLTAEQWFQKELAKAVR